MMKIRIAVLTLFLVIEKSIVSSENRKLIQIILYQVIVRAAMIHLGLWDLAGLF